jgi:hypothetical protein
LVVFGDIGLGSGDNVCGSRIPLSFEAEIVSEYIKGQTRPVDAHSVPHDIDGVIWLEDLILGEDVGPGDEHPGF